MAPRWWHIVPWPRENFNFPRSKMLLPLLSPFAGRDGTRIASRGNKVSHKASSPYSKQWKRILYGRCREEKEIKTTQIFIRFSKIILILILSRYLSRSFVNFCLIYSLDKKKNYKEIYRAYIFNETRWIILVAVLIEFKRRNCGRIDSFARF